MPHLVLGKCSTGDRFPGCANCELRQWSGTPGHGGWSRCPQNGDWRNQKRGLQIDWAQFNTCVPRDGGASLIDTVRGQALHRHMEESLLSCRCAKVN
jgi:hypothetical protein